MDGNLERPLSSNSMPSLISRLDHLDSTMISFEGRKCSSARWSSDGAVLLGDVNRECVPLDLAVKEAISKGSILDRIKSLEDRLIQLCLHTEPGAASPSKNSQMEQNATSPRMSTKGFANSFSRFRLSHHSHNHVCMDNFQVTEEKEQNPKPEPSNEGFQRKKTKKTKDEKASPKQNSLLHLRFFGC